MALKDWERGTKYWNKDSWDHKHSDAGVMVHQVKTKESPSFHKHWVWEFYAENKHQRMDERKLFKTKSQALSYARQYMRTH